MLYHAESTRELGDDHYGLGQGELENEREKNKLDGIRFMD
jgi:hypothetical protein